jgi:hypothetical protein
MTLREHHLSPYAGPAVMAMMPSQVQSYASGSTGYSANHSQYQALTFQARSSAFSSAFRGPSKPGPQILTIPSLKKIIVGVSLKYRKSGVIALKLVEVSPIFVLEIYSPSVVNTRIIPSHLFLGHTDITRECI